MSKKKVIKPVKKVAFTASKKQKEKVVNSSLFKSTKPKKRGVKRSQPDSITDLNAMIIRRGAKDYYKRDKKVIAKEKKKIDELHNRNERIKYQILIRKKEQVRRGTDRDRVRRLDKEIKLLQSEYEPLRDRRNYLKMIQGKDFYYKVDTGFSERRVKRSTLLKSDNPALTYSRLLKKEITSQIKKDEKKLLNVSLTKAQRKKLNSRVFVLNKLHANISHYTTILSGGEEDEEYEEPESGPILVELTGETIHINS